MGASTSSTILNRTASYPKAVLPPCPQGLVRRQNESSTVDGPSTPIHFHSTHGENIRLSRNGFVAKRVESFCKAIVFSNRPVNTDEHVFLKFSEVSRNWSGAVRFGFTNNDPSSLKNGLPKYACPELTNKPGFWAKALPENLVEPGAVLFYYVTKDGNVYYGLNDEVKGVFFSEVDTRKPLWALLDIYGNTVAIEMLSDPYKPLNNARVNNCGRVSPDRSSPELLNINPAGTSKSVNVLNREPETIISQYYPGTYFAPLPFHPVHGANVRMSNSRLVACRHEEEYNKGYVFTARPLMCGERMVVKVLQTGSEYAGALAFGLTSCDPRTLRPTDLPEDCHQLLDRKEYWVVIKDVANSPKPGDELSFSIKHNGEVLFSKNNLPPVTMMHVDQTQKLWAFFDIYGNTQKIKILGCTVGPVSSRPAHQTAAPLHVNLPPMFVASHFEDVDAEGSSSLPPEPSPCSSNDATQDNADNECKVCCERPVNSVLYTCGHMCMCIECAQQLHERPSGGFCPICRAKIRDVIRTFRS